MSDAYEEHTRLMRCWWAMTRPPGLPWPDMEIVEARLELTWRAMTPGERLEARRLAERMNAAEDVAGGSVAAP